MAHDEEVRGMIPQDGIPEVNQWRGNGIDPHVNHDLGYQLNRENVGSVDNLGISVVIVQNYKMNCKCCKEQPDIMQ